MWDANDAAAATGGTRLGRPWRAGGVSIDSRGLGLGDLFVALEGPNHDGHRFVADALKKGAAAAIVHRDLEGLGPEAPLLRVADTQAALEGLGRAGRARAGAKIVGVTGSVGKTSVKEGLRTVLATFGTTHASRASYNNHWGVPLTLASLDPSAAFAAVEMGMNHAGELLALTDIVRPHVGVVTMVAPAHLEFFDGIEAIARAKAEIFTGLVPGGVAVVNADAPAADILLRAAADHAARTITYGAAEGVDLRLLTYDALAEGSKVTADLFGRTHAFAVGAPGRHWAVNALGILAVAAALGLDLDQGAAALAAIRPPEGRGRRRPIPVGDGTATLIDEGYNANPTSMRAAFDLLAATPGRRVAILGDMLELGARAPELHADLAEPLLAGGAELVFTAGPMMRHLFDALPAAVRGAHALDTEALAPLVAAAIAPGDALLVKGSLGSRMARVVAALERR